MQHIKYCIQKFSSLSVIALLCFALGGSVNAQVKSKIMGVVKDASTGEALFGANVVVVGTKLGATTNAEGLYNIINVPVGTYSVTATMIGYAKSTVTEVMVSADRVATIDIQLKSNAYQSAEVVVVAEKNTLHKEVANSQTVVTDQQLSDAAGIREINSFLEKQPGISSNNGYLEIRGGSADQTGVLVNGLSFNNLSNGTADASIPLSAIQQVSLQSGGFNAEYGNFRSGLISVTTKSGDKSKYSGTLNVSKDNPHLRRFGPSMSDPHSSMLAPYLDAVVAFQGTAVGWKDDAYAQKQHEVFDGWNTETATYNKNLSGKDLATPLDLYLLAAWMHMAIPDYAGLEKLGYFVPDAQKRLFADHAWKENQSDYNIDGGFGGPLPFVSEALGDATFYISHNSKDQHYVIPVTRTDQKTSVTMGTIKMNPDPSTSITFNGLYKYQIGVSPMRPAFPNDFPSIGSNSTSTTTSGTTSNYSISDRGGFMPIDNVKYVVSTSGTSGTNYWYDMAMFPILEETSMLGGVSINHVIDNKTYWDLSLSAVSIKDHSPTGDTRNNTALTHFGPFAVSEMPYGKLQFATGNTVTGVFGIDTIKTKYTGLLNYDSPLISTRRFRSKEGDLADGTESQQFRLKYDIVSQLNDHHYVKAGIEYNRIDLRNQLFTLWNNNAYNSAEYIFHRVPSQTGVYAQDQITYEDIKANIGFRADYYYGGGGRWPSDPYLPDAYPVPSVDTSLYSYLASGRSLVWDLWNAYDAKHPGFLQPIENHLALSPRIGVSFPITVNSKFYFNYGHFRSNPQYNSMYLIQYRYTKGNPTISDPGLEPPRTISYELGVAYNFYENCILTVSGYYKDVSGQPGKVAYGTDTSASTLNISSYYNNNYQNIEGLDLNITKNDNSWITGWLNFSYLMKKTGNTGYQTFYASGKTDLYTDQETRLLPIPHATMNITFNLPEDMFSNKYLNQIFNGWKMSVFGEYKAGDYFTWAPTTGSGISRQQNLQWPDYYMCDLRLSKSFGYKNYNIMFYLDIKNVFNIKVNLLSNGNAFADNDNFTNYMKSLHLSMYNSSEFDALRAANPGSYIGGSDKPGELRSSSKPYIIDPKYDYFIYGNPRDIWFGLKIDF